MTCIHRFLDNINTLAKEVERSTRRKKRLQREHLVGAFHFARIVANGVARAVPQALPIATILNGLNAVVESKELQDAPHSVSHP